MSSSGVMPRIEPVTQVDPMEAQENLDRATDAMGDFERAQLLVTRGSFAEAEPLLRRACSADPDQPAYLALLAWVEAEQQPHPVLEGGTPSRKLHRQISMLDQAIGMDPNYIEALYFRGQLLKRSGFVERSLEDFEDVVAQDRQHIGARRELHLFAMRRKRKSGSFFSRLFKGQSA
jgi:tetratricopeptide (TPR) repeat protein